MFFVAGIVMADISDVPVIDVQMDNIEEMWPIILKAIGEASFIAIDFVSFKWIFICPLCNACIHINV